MADAEEFTEEQKRYIVQALACFDPPSIVAVAVKEHFELAVQPSRQRVHRYDPETKAGEELSDQWRLLFAATREAFLKETAKIGIANRAVRLRKLDRVAATAEAKGNFVLLMTALEQAAKEEGGAFTNRRELTGKEGGPIQTEELSAREVLAGRIAGLAARARAGAGAGGPDGSTG